jgi:hypothetical protein
MKRYRPIIAQKSINKKGFREADEAEEKKSQEVIKQLQDEKWSGSNEDQAEAVAKLKGLAMSDTDASNEFMKKLDDFTSGMSSEKKESRNIRKESWDMEDEWDDTDGPAPEDIAIQDGRRGYDVGVIDGGSRDFIGNFVEIDDAEKAIKNYMKKNNYYPNVWFIDDHGGYELYRM